MKPSIKTALALAAVMAAFFVAFWSGQPARAGIGPKLSVLTQKSAAVATTTGFYAEHARSARGRTVFDPVAWKSGDTLPVWASHTTTAGERTVFENAGNMLGAVFEPQVGSLSPRYLHPRTFIASAPTESAVRSAIAQAKRAGGGRVMLPDGGSTGITLTSPLPWVTGVSYEGVMPVLAHASDVPDNEFTFVGGTWFKGDGSFPLFQAQKSDGTVLTTDKGSVDSPFTLTCVESANISKVGGTNFSDGLVCGARNQLGAIYCNIDNVYLYGLTGTAFKLKNYMRLTGSRLYSAGNVHGFQLTQDVASATLQPGNSDFYDVFDQVTGGQLASAAARRLHRSFYLGATAGSNNNQNRIYNLQVNRSGKVKATYTAASGGTAQFTLAAGKGAELSPGMPVKFTNAGGNGNITTGRDYFVYSVSTDTVAVAATRFGAAITGSFSSATTIVTYGWPAVEVSAGTIGTGGSAGTGGTVTNSSFYAMEAENVCQDSLSVENAAGCIFDVTEFVTVTSGEQHVVLRTSQTTNFFRISKPFSSDIDGSSVQNVLVGTWDATNSIQQSGVRLGWNSTSARPSLSFGGDFSVRGADMERRAPSGGQFIYPLATMGQRVHGNNGAGDGSNINAGQSGYLRCTASGTTAIAWNLPTIDSHTVGLWFHIRNARSGGGTPTLNVTAQGTQYINAVSPKLVVALAGPSGTTIAGATFVACDDGAGGNFYWDVILEAGATIP